MNTALIERPDIDEICANLNLTKTDKTCGLSFAANCTFYETRHKGIYLTDYDINWGITKGFDDANLALKNDLLYIFGHGRSLMISCEVITDYDFINKIIDEFTEGKNHLQVAGELLV